MLREPQVESFISRKICECSFCRLLACREIVQHWSGIVLLKRVCFIQQRTIMNTLGGFQKDSWVQKGQGSNGAMFRKKKKSHKIFFSFMGWPVFLSLETRIDFFFYWMQNWPSLFVKQSCALKPNSLMWNSLTLLIIWPSRSKALWLCSSMVVFKVSSDVSNDDSWPSLRSATCCYVTDWKCCL